MIKKRQQLSPLGPKRQIDYKDIELLKSFLTEQGKIKPRHVTNLTVRQQRQLSRAIKRSRILNLLSFADNRNLR